MSYDFTTSTHGKWILAGEHAVLRGHAALVFPIPSFQFTVTYKSSTAPLHIHALGSHDSLLPSLVQMVISDALHLLGKSSEILLGEIHINNTISLGAGLGGSAAICVSIARWLSHLKLLNSEQIQDFSRELEHRFHGQSSGLDIAGVSNTRGVYFKQGHQDTVYATWQPYWYLSPSAVKGKTCECIAKVHDLWKSNETLARTLDLQMSDAVTQCLQALSMPKVTGLTQLIQGIKSAEDCFAQWGLISGALQQHIDTLKAKGALAVKPTGSGGGGYVLSVWATPVSDASMIPVYSIN